MSRKKRLWFGGILVFVQLLIILSLSLVGPKTPITPVKEADAQCMTFWLSAANNAVPTCPSGTLLGYAYTGIVAVYGGTATRYVGLCARDL